MVTFQEYYDKLETFLLTNYPNCILMPTASNFTDNAEKGKQPYRAHKNVTSEDLWKDWRTKGKFNCQKGLVLLIREGLIALDIDDKQLADELEARFPDIKRTSIQETSKGRHYLFRRTKACDKASLYDHSRCICDPSDPSKILEIDIKTRCKNGTAGVLSIYPSPNKQWLRIPYKQNPIDIPDELVEFLAVNHIHNFKKQGNSKPKALKNVIVNNEDDELRALLNMLSPSRFNNYDSWIRIGWCLHNMNPNTLLPVWIEYSKRSNKFVPGECERLWNNMREGLGIGSLHLWAKQDNPTEYIKFLNIQILPFIKNCDGSHNSVAAIAHKILRDRYVCASSTGKLWYFFNGSLWQQDDQGIMVRHALSTSVREQFIHAYTRLKLESAQTKIDSASQVSGQDENEAICIKLLSIAFKLQDAGFKDSVMKEMREYMFNKEFLELLDSMPNLVPFNNGVYDLKTMSFRNAEPSDYVSLSTGYKYLSTKNYEKATIVIAYFQKMHPDPERRLYVLKTLARQLYGDSGHELMHIHAGFNGSASNGKTKFFELLELILGDLITSFSVQRLVQKERDDPSKPMPEFGMWKGRRIIYCTEPNYDDVFNTGIIKDLTGGETIRYRELFSNTIIKFRPQYKIHCMCNDTPRCDGTDKGGQRRLRMIEYVSKFVDANQVNEEEFMFKKDPNFIEGVKNDHELRMEFMRYLLEHYDPQYEFTMPEVIRIASQQYLQDNNPVHKFICDYIVPTKDPKGHFVLSDAKSIFMQCEYFNKKIGTFKRDLEELLKTKCFEQKKINNAKLTNVFMGFKIIMPSSNGIMEDDDGID